MWKALKRSPSLPHLGMRVANGSGRFPEVSELRASVPGTLGTRPGSTVYSVTLGMWPHLTKPPLCEAGLIRAALLPSSKSAMLVQIFRKI